MSRNKPINDERFKKIAGTTRPKNPFRITNGFFASIKINKQIILLNKFITQKQKVKEPIKLIDFKLKPKAFAFE